MSEHDQTPPNPHNGDTFTCTHCGYTTTYIDLNDGKPGEWV